MTIAAGRPELAEALAVDVLIIGGGLMGLWLLDDLRGAGYSAVLLERHALGGGQTCHSHVYLHQGHVYREVELARHLSDVTRIWRDWLRQHPPPTAGEVVGAEPVGPAYFGFANPVVAERKADLWSSPGLGLPFKRLPEPPAVFSHDDMPSEIRVAFESPEICLSGGWLVRTVASEVEDATSQVTEITAVRRQADRVTEVRAALPGGRSLLLRPRALVLTAGAGNGTTLPRVLGAGDEGSNESQAAQQLRKGHMLVVRGAESHLPPLTGVFEPSGLFIVSRRLPDGDTVWLVSDRRSPTITSDADLLTHSATAWLPGVIAALERLLPAPFSRPDHLRWGVYEALKAEGTAGGRVPTEWRIETFGMANVWAVWPTKLTLVPAVSPVLVGEMGKVVSPGGTPVLPRQWSEQRVPVPFARERWEITPLHRWRDFAGRYGLLR